MIAVKLKAIWNYWDGFWFSPRSLLALGIFRAILMFSLGSLYLARIWDVSRYFTDQGLVPKDLALKIYSDFYQPPFLLAAWPDSWALPLQVALTIGAFLLAFGIGGRILNICIWFLHLAFLQRNFAIAFGADMVGGIFLMLMCGTQSCARFSILNIWKKQSLQKSDIFTGVFYRLIQIQLLVIYFWTGFEKLKGASWWDGTALWTVFANPQMAAYDMTWTKSFPLGIAALTLATLLFEIYFPVLVLVKKSRPYALAAGIAFHLGIGFIISLWGFSCIMLSPYALFMEEGSLEGWQALIVRKLPWS